MIGYKLLFLTFFVLLIGVSALAAAIKGRKRRMAQAADDRAKGEILILLARERMSIRTLEQKLKHQPRKKLSRYLWQLRRANLITRESILPNVRSGRAGATFYAATENGKTFLLNQVLRNRSTS
jgi:DNA-binding HxlR family transcriptional regulator